MILVNIANNPWSSQELKRNQSIFTELLGCGAFDGGIYINPAVPFASRMARYTPRCRLESAATQTVRGKKTQIFGLSSSVYGFRNCTFSRLLMHDAVAAIRAAIGGRAYALWINSAEYPQVHLAENLLDGATWSVFDSSDDFTTMPHTDPQEFEKRLRALVARCSHSVCVTANIAAKLPHPRTRIFPNGTHFDILAGSVRKTSPTRDHTVGFTGGLHACRVNMELLEYVTRCLPQALFVFAGYIGDGLREHRLWSLPNVRQVPPVPYTELGSLIRTFDVAIVPHLDNEHTRGNDLLKVLEYLACGVPVVSTDCSNVRQYGEAVHVARTPQEFADTVESLLAGCVRHDPRPGIAAARSRSWSAMVPELLPWLETSA